MKSYKEEFLQWAKDNKVEVFQNLSDVLPDSPYELKAGQTCTFRNYVFLDFPGCTIMGFCKPTSWGACVYLDGDSYWYPVIPEYILLDGTKDQQCNVEITFDRKCVILIINRVRCVLQSYIKDDYVNLSPVQNGGETFDEQLPNVRIDFYNKKISTEGHESIKWHNFTRTIDIDEIRKVIDEIDSNKCPACKSIRVCSDNDFPLTIRCCQSCGSKFDTNEHIILNAQEA